MRENCRGGGLRKVSSSAWPRQAEEKDRDTWRHTLKMMPEALDDRMASTSEGPDTW